MAILGFAFATGPIATMDFVDRSLQFNVSNNFQFLKPQNGISEGDFALDRTQAKSDEGEALSHDGGDACHSFMVLMCMSLEPTSLPVE